MVICQEVKAQIQKADSVFYTSLSNIQSIGFYKNHGIVKKDITICISKDKKPIGTDILYLKLNNPHINRITVYGKNKNQIIHTGDIYKFSQRPIIFNDFIIPISDLLRNNDTIYMRLDKKNENLSYLLEIEDNDTFPSIQNEQIFLLGASIALTFILVIYFIILGIISEKKYNYIFAAYIITTCFWFLNNGGFLFQYVWPERPNFHNISRTLFSTITITAFSLFILDYYKENINFLYRIIKYIIYVFMPIRIIALFIKNNYDGENQLKYIFLIINAFILTTLFISLILFIVSNSKQKNKWLHSAGFLLYAISLFLEVSHQYNFDPLPIYHQSVFFPYIFLTGQIFLIGSGSLLNLLKTNKLIAKRKFQELLEIDNDLAKNIVSVQEYERTQIGEELHDKIGAELSISKIKTETIVKKYPHFEGNNEISEIGSLINNVIKEIRFIISSVMPLQIENQNSKDLFRVLIQQFQQAASFNIELNYYIEKNLPQTINIQLYRIISELLTNTLKHSTCTFVKIVFNINKNKMLELIYLENTKGFQPHDDPTHFGIKNIKHRVSFLKGKLQRKDTDSEMIYFIEIPLYDN